MRDREGILESMAHKTASYVKSTTMSCPGEKGNAFSSRRPADFYSIRLEILDPL
jgi:hypothetical protein